MTGHGSGHFRYGKRLGSYLGQLLVVLLIAAHINVGCYAWINNDTAVIPDNDPATIVHYELYDGIDGNEPDFCQLTRAENAGLNPLKSQRVVRGNGNHDDNREKPFTFRRDESEMISVAWIPAATSFEDRRTVVAYWDYGHLRVITNSMVKNLEEG